MHHGVIWRRAWIAALVTIVMVVMTVAPAAQAAPRPPARVDRSGANALSREPLADLAASLDYDLTRIFRYVADEIRYEPYPGILRGARGTLAAHAGNSADQALLLGALLDESLIPYRFAQGTIDAETAAALLASTAMTVAGTRDVSEAVLIGDARAARDEDVQPGPEDETRGAAVAAGVDKTVATAQRQLLDGVASIEDALREAAIDLPDAEVAPALPALERSTHTWVQASQGADWVDLDPILPTLQAGEALTAPAATVETLPDVLRHRVDFLALAERVRAGELVTEPILEFGAFADQLRGVSVTFGHIKPSGLERLGITIRRIAGGEAGLQYSPVFDVDGRAIVAEETIAFGNAGPDAGLFGDLFGDDDIAGPTEPPADAGAAEGDATAEWLEVRITDPEGKLVVARRTIFDRVDPEARQSGTATPGDVTPLDLVDLDGTGDPDFAPLLRLESFAIATGATNGTMIAARSADAGPAALGRLALSYHYLRDALSTGLALELGVRDYLRGPNVVSLAVTPDTSTPDPSVRVGLDVWHRDVGILPLTDGSVPPGHSQVLVGVLGHVAERAALDDGSDAADPGAPPPIGVGAVFEAAARDAVPIRAFRGGLPDGLTYGPRADALIGEALAAGDTVIIPERPVSLGGRQRVGWWRVDPLRGTTSDQMDDGRGEETTEYQIPLTRSFKTASCLLALSGTIFDVLDKVLEKLELSGWKEALSWVKISFQGAAGYFTWAGKCK